MNPDPPMGQYRPLDVRSLRFPGVDISWAGQGASGPEICLGTEDGRLIFTAADGTGAKGHQLSISHSGNSINGVAYSGAYLAASTTSEVVFCRKGSADGGDEPFVYQGGSHGVVSTPSGLFVAPLGVNGLLSFRPRPGAPQELTVIRATKGPLNFYKGVSLGANGIGDVVCCALRHDGLAAVVHGGSSGSFNLITCPGLDVVDVCPLGSEDLPFAVAALGKDGSIHYADDVLSGHTPTRVKLASLRGAAYRVLRSQGHILILTSVALYTLSGLATRFLSGSPATGPVQAGRLDIEAVDAEVVFDRLLLVVTPDGGVAFIEVEKLVSQSVGVFHGSPTSEADPVWEALPSQPLEFACV